MKDFTDKVMLILYGLFGAGLGFLIFLFALGGWHLILAGRATSAWNGWISLLICCGLGGGWGLVSYKFSDVELGSAGSNFYHDQASAMIFGKRLMVVATCVAGLYFIWQLARGK